MKFTIFVVFLTLWASTQAIYLNVTVYYESLCSDSRQFITAQLAPAYLLLKEYLNVEFVPFGKAQIFEFPNGRLIFVCQHGAAECYGNQVHGCALALKPENAMSFVPCAMSREDPSDDSDLQPCAMSSGISWDAIKECMSTGQGEEIFIRNGARTEALNVDYVPSIYLNNVHNSSLQAMAENYFLRTACSLLDQEPSVCETI